MSFELKKLPFPEYNDRIMKDVGRVIVNDLIYRVRNRLKPDNTPQQTNSQGWIEHKKHDHPLVYKTGRFLNPNTYQIVPLQNLTVEVFLTGEAAQIAGSLEEKNYDFFELSDNAVNGAFVVMDKWIEKLVQEAFK